MTTITRRLNKKQQHISGLVFDIDHLETELKRMVAQKQFKTWWQGDYINRIKVRSILTELRDELEKINNDETYKPWE
jgi:chaperonin cofactor prefoldin